MVVVLCFGRRAFGTCSGYHVVDARIGSPISEAISLAIATVVCFSVSARIFRPMPDRIGDWEREWCRDLYAGAGALFAMTLVWLKLPPPLVALVWTALGLALFEIGVRFAGRAFRLLAHLIAAAVCPFDYLFSISLELGDAVHITYRTFTIVPILASHYYVWWRDQQQAAYRVYLYAAAILFRGPCALRTGTNTGGGGLVSVRPGAL